MTTLYFDCFSGVAGDMVLGALLDAGAEQEPLLQITASLQLQEEVEISVGPEHRGGIAGTRVRVRVRSENRRTVDELRRLMGEAGLPPRVRERSLGALETLIRAESQVHGEAVPHLHEAGGADAMIDIVGAYALMENLGIEAWHVSPVAVGSGMVDAAHGQLPVPAPATLQILAAAGATIRPLECGRELATPTGAAIITTGAAGFTQPLMAPRRIGYGIGGHELPWPNALRVWLGDDAAGGGVEVEEIQCQVDDMPGTVLADLPALLLEAGALDAFLTPVLMKKGRPGTLITALAPPGGADALAAILMDQTSTLGCRISTRRRLVAARHIEEIDTEFGRIRYKISDRQGRAHRIEPEMEDCRRAAEASGRPLWEVQRLLMKRGLEWLEQ